MINKIKNSMQITFYPDPWHGRERGDWDEILPIVTNSLILKLEGQLENKNLNGITTQKLTEFKDLCQQHIGEIYIISYIEGEKDGNNR